MKKDDSFKRVSAIIMGDTLCSSKKYKGPIFARKKPLNYKSLFYTLLLIGASISCWELFRRQAPKVMADVSHYLEGRKIASEQK